MNRRTNNSIILHCFHPLFNNTRIGICIYSFLFYLFFFCLDQQEKICAVCFNTFFIEAEDSIEAPSSGGTSNCGHQGTTTAAVAATSANALTSARPSSISFAVGASAALTSSHENGRQQRPYSEPPGDHGNSGHHHHHHHLEGIATSAENFTSIHPSGRYRILSLNKSQLDKACKAKEFPETASVKLLFDASVRHPAASGNGNSCGSVAGSGSGSEERRSEGGSPAEEDSSEEDEASYVRM